jgi:AcrR family transcriptional regulator
METEDTYNVSISIKPMSEEDIVKERIISFCQDRFTMDGFAGISVDEISSGLAISKKTFYKYFSSKEDVVQQILERFMGTIRANVERILLSDKSAVEKYSEVITMIGTNASRLIPAFGRDLQRRMPHLWKQVEDFRRQRISDVFTRLNHQGILEGTMRPDMNPRVFLMSVLASIDRIMQPEVLANESFSFGGAIEEILGIFFKGAMTQKGRDQFDEFMLTHNQNT